MEHHPSQCGGNHGVSLVEPNIDASGEGITHHAPYGPHEKHQQNLVSAELPEERGHVQTGGCREAKRHNDHNESVHHPAKRLVAHRIDSFS